MAFLTKFRSPRGDEIDANSAPEPVPEDRTFPLFSSLPKELRLQIWEEVTPRQRVLHISIGVFRNEDGTMIDPPVRYLDKNHLEKPVSGSLYWISMDDPRLKHPLLTVNREARKVVLDFYRIHMPAHCSMWRGSRELPGYDALKTLYINPEHDVLQIRAEEPVSRSLIDFFWDLKAYDPKDVGLLRFATDQLDFNNHDLQYLKRSDLMLIRQRQALFETLSQLQEVWFINTEPVKNGFVRRFGGTEGTFPFGLRFVEFENVGLETEEGAETALQNVHMGMVDPRELVWRWKRLLHRWQIHHPPGQVKYRVIMARRQLPWDHRSKVGRLGRMMGALSLRSQEQSQCMSCCSHKDSRSCSSLPDQLIPEEPDGSKAPAVGFWSFPIESVGDVGGSETLNDADFEADRILDLRSHWPELLVAKLPPGRGPSPFN